MVIQFPKSSCMIQFPISYNSSVFETIDDKTFCFIRFKHFCFKNAFIFKRFCIDYALGNFVSSFLSRFKCLLLLSQKSVCKHPVSVRFAKNAWMETERFELLTPCLQGRCSPNWATPPFRWRYHSFVLLLHLFIQFDLSASGLEKTRTSDLTLIRRAL